MSQSQPIEPLIWKTLTQSNHFNKLQVTKFHFDVLRYHAANPGVPYSKLPPYLKKRTKIESVRSQGYLKRRYGPEKFFVTSKGHQLLSWLEKLAADNDAA